MPSIAFRIAPACHLCPCKGVPANNTSLQFPGTQTSTVPLRDGKRWVCQNINVHNDVAAHAPGAQIMHGADAVGWEAGYSFVLR